ncbi:S-layer homology domain-containing protein [uncultured Phascolarctobacterium sp.]|uniref:S-layer homology domain-containing protein n=1 Tax=uncultured Phascolarctobacterium sp. TaxID=512296 RepID=UPI0026080023|nr:S-layer homology domain-containing protein [uncultured Phascolarctobacterium sp.]
MKKSLVLAMAMALGVTASAYAANPFSDVPAGHWAYDSINKLAAAGIVDGYGDNTFGGDRLMTRYEMAQIVAKAMAKGANVDRLAAEFADELDSLGVRVAALEKKSDNVKITGEARFRYADSNGKGNVADDYVGDLRSRIWLTGQINEDWKYTGMIENIQDFAGDYEGDEDTSFQRAYVEGKLGGMNVTAGRYNAFFANGNIYDNRADGVELAYGDKVKVSLAAGKATDAIDKGGYTDKETGGNYAGGAVSADFGSVNATAGYYNFKDILQKDSGIDNAIWFVGAGTTFGDFGLNAMYLKGDLSDKDGDVNELDDDGYTVGLTWKGAEAAEVGSYGLFANYYDLGGQTYIAHTTDADTFDGEGFKGYGVGANYTVAKNMVFTAAYYDTKSKLHSSDKDKIIWTDLTITF